MCHIFYIPSCKLYIYPVFYILPYSLCIARHFCHNSYNLNQSIVHINDLINDNYSDRLNNYRWILHKLGSYWSRGGIRVCLWLNTFNCYIFSISRYLKWMSLVNMYYIWLYCTLHIPYHYQRCYLQDSWYILTLIHPLYSSFYHFLHMFFHHSQLPIKNHLNIKLYRLFYKV